MSHFEPSGVLGYLSDAVVVSRAFLGRFWGFFRGFVGAVLMHDDLFLGIPKSAVCVRFVRGYICVRACVYARIYVRVRGAVITEKCYVRYVRDNV